MTVGEFLSSKSTVSNAPALEHIENVQSLVTDKIKIESEDAIEIDEYKSAAICEQDDIFITEEDSIKIMEEKKDGLR